jgi:hypothetical protein
MLFQTSALNFMDEFQKLDHKKPDLKTIWVSRKKEKKESAKESASGFQVLFLPLRFDSFSFSLCAMYV